MENEKAKAIGKIYGSKSEEEELTKLAKDAGLSKSNYLRRLLGWGLNQTYAPEGNTRAAGNKGRGKVRSIIKNKG